MAVIQAKSQAALGECHTLFFTKFFKRWRVRCSRFEGEDIDQRVKGKLIPVHAVKACRRGMG